MPANADKSERLLNLIDKAWDAQSEDGYSAVIAAAREYLFVREDEPKLAPDIDDTRDIDPRVERQIARIQDHMDRHAAQGSGAGHEDIGVLFAQMTLLPAGQIVEANAACATLFDGPPQHLSDLGLDHASVKSVQSVLANLAEGVSPQRHILHLLSEWDDRPIFALCHLVTVERHGARLRALRLSLSYVQWTPQILSHLAAAMGLTKSEAEVLGLLLEGVPQKDIAARRDRSVDTVKAQIKSILRKAGTARTTDLVQLCCGIAFMLNVSRDSGEPITEIAARDDIKVEQFLRLRDGRTLSFHVYGAEFGRPVLFFHGQIQGPYFTRAFCDGLKRHNIALYCPSRPGFGHTDAAESDAAFNQTVLKDTLELVAHIGAPRLPFIVLQGGVSHAFRAAGALGPACQSMLMVDAGIPIEEAYIAKMERQTQLAAYAVKYAPSVLNLVTRVAIATHRKNLRGFLEKLYKDAPIDLATLEIPELRGVQERGAAHVIAQGHKAFINDGRAAMQNWHNDFEACRETPQHWLHPSDCPIMKAEFVTDYVGARTDHRVEIVPNAGYTLLHTHGDLVLSALAQHLS